MNTFGDFAVPAATSQSNRAVPSQQKKSFAAVVSSNPKASQHLTEDELRYMYNNTSPDGSISLTPVQQNIRQNQPLPQQPLQQNPHPQQQPQQISKNAPSSYSIQNISNPTLNQEAAMKMSPLNPANAVQVTRKDPGFVLFHL
jgi:hypothetical protein